MLKKLKNKKGFTLAELLIVVAIIGVLVAISIPIFTSQLEKARESVDVSNLRAAYAVGQAEALTSSPSTAVTKYYNPSTGTLAETKTTCGKGTATTTTAVWDLPSVCTYNTGDNNTTKGIKIIYDATGVTSCLFD